MGEHRVKEFAHHKSEEIVKPFYLVFLQITIRLHRLKAGKLAIELTIETAEAYLSFNKPLKIGEYMKHQVKYSRLPIEQFEKMVKLARNDRTHTRATVASAAAT